MDSKSRMGEPCNGWITSVTDVGQTYRIAMESQRLEAVAEHCAINRLTFMDVVMDGWMQCI